MSKSTKSQKELERARRTYGRPTLVKREKLASVTAIPVTSGISADTASR